MKVIFGVYDLYEQVNNDVEPLLANSSDAQTKRRRISISCSVKKEQKLTRKTEIRMSKTKRKGKPSMKTNLNPLKEDTSTRRANASWNLLSKERLSGIIVISLGTMVMNVG